jgi:YVTN family beta-propeller protein
VFVTDTATNTVNMINDPSFNPYGVAVSPDGRQVYVTNFSPPTVSVIDAATNKVTATIPVDGNPYGVAVSPNGSRVYAVTRGSSAGGSMSVIDTATNKVTTTITDPSFVEPIAFGIFIQPAPKFAGSPGKANCYGKSVSALARQYGGLKAAAAALGYSSVSALKHAIRAYCAG